MAESDVINVIRAQYPFPWRTIVHPNGLMQVADKNNVEVSLVALTDFACFLTNALAAKGEKTA